MPKTETAIVSEEQIAEIKAVNERYRIDWRYPDQRKRIDALCATVRALQSRLAEVEKERDDLRLRLRAGLEFRL